MYLCIMQIVTQILQIFIKSIFLIVSIYEKLNSII